MSEIKAATRYILNTLKFPHKAKYSYRTRIIDKTNLIPKDFKWFFESLNMKQSNKVIARPLSRYIEGNIPTYILYLAKPICELLHVRAICIHELHPHHINPVKTLLFIGNVYHICIVGTLLKYYHIAIRNTRLDVLRREYAKGAESPNTEASKFRGTLVRELDSILKKLLESKINLPEYREFEYETLFLKRDKYILNELKINYRKLKDRGPIKDLSLATVEQGTFKIGKLLW